MACIKKSTTQNMFTGLSLLHKVCKEAKTLSMPIVLVVLHIRVADDTHHVVLTDAFESLWG